MLKMSKKHFTKEETKKIGDKLGIDWNEFSLDELTAGMDVELEHGTTDSQTNVTNDDPEMTFKIALAHAKECKTYYKRLAQMEKEYEDQD